MSDEEKNVCEQNSSNEEVKNFLAITYLLGIFISFVAPLVIWILKKDSLPSTANCELSKFFNFELIVAIFMAVLSFVPFLGWLVSGVLAFANILICIIATLQVKSDKEVKFPLQVELIKLS